MIPQASPEEIKVAYRNRAREAHPDRHPGDSKEQNAEMSLINEAYSVLSNRDKRTGYDIIWRRYYKTRGRLRKKGGDVSRLAHEWNDDLRLDHPVVEEPVRQVLTESIPFWKDQRVLIGILIVLVIILAIDVYLTYFRGASFGSGMFREIAYGYEYTLGKDFRDQASNRHLDRSRNIPAENIDERLWRLNRALELNPDNIEVAREITQVLLETGRYEETVRISRHALLLIEDLDENPTAQVKSLKIDFLHFLYRAYFELDMWQNAHTILAELESIGFSNEGFLYDFAVVKFELNMTTDARTYAQRFLAEYPNNPMIPDAEVLLVRTWIADGNYTEAEAVGLAAIGNDPANPALNHVLGESYFLEGRYSSAIEYLEKGIPASADPVNTNYMIGLSYFKSGSVQAAIATLTEVVMSDPDNFFAHMWLGRAYQSISDLDKARNHFYSALEIDPNNQEAKNALDNVPRE